MTHVSTAALDLAPVLAPIGEAQRWALGLLLAFIVGDVLAGMLKAAKAGELSSAKAREGAWHKAGELLIAALAVLVEFGSAHLDLGFTAPLIVPVCTYLILNEAMSILENAAELNPELKGSKVMQLFASTKATDKTDTETEGADHGQD